MTFFIASPLIQNLLLFYSSVTILVCTAAFMFPYIYSSKPSEHALARAAAQKRF